VYGKDRDTFVGKANGLLEAMRIERDEEDKDSARGDDAEPPSVRPVIFLCHSMGGLLVKQALINAHNNPKYTPIKAATSGLAFFAIPHNGGDWKLVSLGSLASKIATTVGFQQGDDVVDVLKNGSMFSDIMQEHWRHQLLEYDIVSFWGALDNVSGPAILPLVLMLSTLCKRLSHEGAHAWACRATERTWSSWTRITLACASSG
jgi:hypothetical protein